MTLKTLADRLTLAECDLRDHAKSISAITTEVGLINEWRTAINLMTAREDERDKALYRRLDEIERSVEGVRTEAIGGVKEIKGAASRVQWIVISVVIGGVVAFIFKGGLSI